MARKFSFLFLFSVLVGSSAATMAQTDGKKDTRTAIHLLEYIMQDYPNAVQHGKEVSKGEYDEMLEFSERVSAGIAQNVQLKSDADLSYYVKRIQNTIAIKGSYDTVNYYTFCAKERIFKLTGYDMVPEKWPDLSAGKVIFKDQCSACHGNSGNGMGPAAQGMDPPPRNFLDNERMKRISPASAFNTIRLGIEGTSMKGNIDLSDEDTWNLAFYVLSLRYQDVDSTTLTSYFGKIQDKLDLKSMASLTDSQWVTRFAMEENDRHKMLSAIHLGIPVKVKNDYLSQAKCMISEAVSLYDKGEFGAAKKKAIDAYLEGVEPVELQLKSLDPALVGRLEARMMDVRKAIDQKLSVIELRSKAQAANSVIDEASKLLAGNKPGFAWIIFMTLTILIREALEALLVVIILINVLKAAGAESAIRWIHAGWIMALFAGIITWLFSESLVNWGMGKIELFEGIVSLISVIMVVYIGFWMHSHTEINKWKSFINDKVGKMVKNENFMGLALLSFIVVGREVFESVLFLTALNVESKNTGNAPIGIGFLIAIGIMIGIGYIMLKVTKNLPVRQILRVSSFILGLLAVILAGKTVHSFQETGYIPIHGFPLNIRFEILGLFPTLETIIAQLTIGIVIVIVLNYPVKKKL